MYWRERENSKSLSNKYNWSQVQEPRNRTNHSMDSCELDGLMFVSNGRDACHIIFCWWFNTCITAVSCRPTAERKSNCGTAGAAVEGSKQQVQDNPDDLEPKIVEESNKAKVNLEHTIIYTAQVRRLEVQGIVHHGLPPSLPLPPWKGRRPMDVW